MTATFTIDGEDELMDKLRALFPKFAEAAEAGCADWGEDVMYFSKRLCPVDTGELRASGYVETYSGQSNTWIEVVLGYPKDYAIYVHENMEAHHEVGQAKFLETPMLLKSNELPKRMVQEMERAAERVA